MKRIWRLTDRNCKSVNVPTWVISSLVALLFLLALALRSHDLDTRTISHPENLVSGIPMPRWVSPAARRVDWATLVQGTLQDGHPPFYFAAMLLWTKAFGHGLFALRLPSALLGAFSVLLLYRIGLRVTSRSAAIMASLLLALNGFHVYWSQIARMYVPAGFLVLLSTLVLLRLRNERTRRLQWAYGLTTAAALWTQLYVWPAIVVHILWTGWRWLRAKAVPSVVPALALALISATPVVALALYQNPGTRWHQNPWGFFAFGYAFSPVVPFWGPVPIAPVNVWVLGAVTFGLLTTALFRPEVSVNQRAPDSEFLAENPGRFYFTGLAALSGVTAVAIYRFALWVPAEHPGRSALMACSLAPLAIGVLTWWSMNRFRERVQSSIGAGVRGASHSGLVLIVLLTVLPLVIMSGVSLLRGVLVARGTVVFLPFLLLSVAAGAQTLGNSNWWQATAFGLLVTLSVSSMSFYSQAQNSPRDYAGLAQVLRSHLKPEDLVLLIGRYADPPFLYYFEGMHHQFVGRNHSRRLATYSSGRVWVITWGGAAPSGRILEALEGYRPSGQVLRSHNAVATRYTNAK